MISRVALATAIGLALVASASPVDKRYNYQKRGIAWPYFENAQSLSVASFGDGNGKIGWDYNYENTYKPYGQPGAMEWNAMIRTRDGIENLGQYTASAGPWILGFNEPDICDGSQACLSPTDAANLWKQYVVPLKQQGHNLVSPAVTSSSNAGQGIDWLNQFMSACAGACEIDAYAIHPYAADAASVQGSIDYFAQHYSPLWVTEFGRDGANQNNGGATDFMSSMLNYLENKNEVQRYAYIARVNPDSANQNVDLQNTDGSMTALGQIYFNQ